MSWLEQVNTEMVIQTGDGKQFTPKWMNAKVAVEYNTAQYNFPNVKGTLVDRREMKGSKFTLEIFFQGDNHLSQMKDFVLSAADPRFWIISHPYYDILTVQPLSLDINNDKYNVSKITIPVIQTITDVYPQVIVIIEDKVEEDAEAISVANGVNFVNNVMPSSRDKNQMTAMADAMFANAVNKVVNDADGEELFNKYNDTKSKILNAVNNALAAMEAILDFIAFIAYLEQALSTRLSIVKGSQNSVRNNLLAVYQTLDKMPNSMKRIYEYVGAGFLTTLALTAARPFSVADYANRVQVGTSIDCLGDTYTQYLADLDTMEVGSGGDIDDYVPSSESIMQLNELVFYTQSNLFDLALNAKQERFFTLEDDSNFITLTHRLYGLDSEDANLDELMRNNALGLNAILNIKKGTKITYYI
jgi:hypothetical protein